MTTTIALLEELVGLDTTSNRSNLTLVHRVADRLDGIGARVRLSYDDGRSKANILASFGPKGPGGVVLSGHTDVVPVDDQNWSSDPFRLTERNGKLYGRGVADMKGFVAACLAAAGGFSAADLARPIHIALSYDEEVGCLGVPRLIEDLLTHEEKPELAIIGEPTGMRLGDRHRGFLGFRTRFDGKAAHSSDPSAGASAIYPAADFVSFLKSVGHRAGAGIDQTTVNIGRIQGGSAINIVPSACEVVWEFRPVTPQDAGEIEQLVAAYLTRALPSEVRQSTCRDIHVPPLAAAGDASALGVAAALGGIGPPFAMPFGTEAGFFQAAGMSAVVCGPGSIAQAHQPDEWIERSQLDAADAFLIRLTDWAACRPF
ncbi:acetylornithine deacetylase [Phreatobacter aquaticus]|uniref:Acetylornithine deacetylase n=1 Tax=Phreatobacter aquaticus TaxID=2570229 RepID=A0A4D7QJ47_9HYPH|nr:acetylornithine deacetylase [Phreatobacter aquaticus]QCK85376.1 acetylornithine deacetylase [Phreatobacter aquaticus]